MPVSAEDRARMLQAEDLGDLILFVATRPKRVCINEVLIGPAWNRSYLRMRGRLRAEGAAPAMTLPRYSITASARLSRGSETVRPSLWAVFRLITNSNFVGSSTGSSAGLAPLRIRPV